MADGSPDSYLEQKAEVAEPKVEISNSELIVPTETISESHARTGEANPKPQTTNLAKDQNFLPCLFRVFEPKENYWKAPEVL